MLDTTKLDQWFDAAMAVTGQPPATHMFDRRVLFPVDALPALVQQESGEELEPGRIAEIRAAGWFRLDEWEGDVGVPLFVASRIGLFLKLERMGHTHTELREFAEYEDGTVDGLWSTDELAYEDDDLRLLIDTHEQQLEAAKNSIRVLDEPGWTPENGSWGIGRSREECVEEREMHENVLRALHRYVKGGIPDSVAEAVQRAAFHVRMMNEFVRLTMVFNERKQAEAGFSFFVTFDGMAVTWAGTDPYEPPFPIDWRSTVRRPWFAENPLRRVFLPGLILEGEQVRLTAPVAPAKYEELWRTYDLDEFFAERAEMLDQRVCLNCFAALPEDSDRRRRYCCEPCRNAAKQKRFRRENPRMDLEHKRRYYSSLPPYTRKANDGD